MNAQKELIEHVKDMEVKFVSIVLVKSSGTKLLQVKGCLDDVLPHLNFDYDNGYGSQKLFGYIWYEDGTWSDRGEYDGSEWWQHQVKPDIDVEIEI